MVSSRVVLMSLVGIYGKGNGSHGLCPDVSTTTHRYNVTTFFF